jgi:Mg-chelatase subunit ChlD
MASRREIQVFSISFLDLLSGALGAVIILFIAVPKAKGPQEAAQKAQVMDVKTEISQNVPGNSSETLHKEINFLSAKVRELETENKALQDKLANMETPPEASFQQEQGKPVDIGFKFKGKKIVFLIDVSGSMHDEDRIGQVKAGLKMLITSMDKDFMIDVVYFPNGDYGSYQALWSALRPMETQFKYEVYDFLFDLLPYGSTPTRSALEYALSTYPTATDIVLLSDGAPTMDGSAQGDDIRDLLNMVSRMNTAKIQINSIGVGSDFMSSRNSSAHRFLSELAKENSGFFVGF